MNNLIDFWINMVTNFEKKLDEVPSKIKSAVVTELYKIGYITNEDINDVLDAKISEMNNICNLTILNGFDIVLSDGNTYHFSLDYTDQTRISKLNDKAVAGETFLPWHCDNGSCKVFTPEDIIAINKSMENIITFQTTYYNSLRDYIKSLDNIKDIIDVTYGVDIPEEYQSEVLKILYKANNEE